MAAVDFIGTEDIEEELAGLTPGGVGEMQGLNLFGVQIDQRATEEAFNRDTKR
jgi:hypothetical protein